MKKRVLACVLLVLYVIALAGCACEHSWRRANCEDPKTCRECGETEGEPEHDWLPATCQEPKTCEECGETKGKPKEHTWREATCYSPEYCEDCGEYRGDVVDHLWQGDYCAYCGEAAALSLTIRVWTPSEDQAEEGNNWLEKMEKQFEAAHPEYKITWKNESCSEGDAANNITTDVTDSADVYMFANDQLGRLIMANGLAELGGDFKDQVKHDNTQFAINTVTHTDGGIYAFPVTGNVWFTYYNKAVYTEEDVKSLDTMLEKGMVCLPVVDAWNAGFVFLGCGGTVFGPAGNDAAAGINFGGGNGYMAAEKMISYAKLVQKGKAIAGGMDAGKLIDGEADAIFSGSWSYRDLKAALGDNLGVAPLPYFTIDGRNYPMTALGGTKCVGVNPNSGTVAGKQRACTEFAAFLASEEAQLERYNMRGVIPVHKNLAENDRIKRDPAAVAEIATMNNNAVVQSSLPEMGNYWTPVATFSQSVYAGDINERNYKEAVNQLMEQLNAEW